MYHPKAQSIILGTTKGLKPMHFYFNQIFRQTLSPKEGDALNILGYLQYLLEHTHMTSRFNVFDFMFEELRLSFIDPRRS